MTLSPQSKGLTLRSLVVSLGLLVVNLFWIRHVELVAFTCQITESIPPIPALASLLFLVLVNPLLKRLGPRWGLTRAELGTIYVFVGISSVMSAVGVTQAFLPYLTVPFYFAMPENRLEEIQSFLPAWFGPRDSEAIRCFYEGSEGGAVPWGEWLRPLGLWLLFFVGFWGTALCLWAILRRQWAETERLTFPLLFLPLNLMQEDQAGGAERPFFRNPLMWLGFGLAAVYNLMNILHAFNPAVVALDASYHLGSLFTEKPLNALQAVWIWYRPELVGLGYLISQEVLFSVWFFYLLQRVASVLGLAFGLETPGFPFEQEQGMSAYVIVALFLLWSARRHLGSVLRRALSGRRPIPSEAEEPLPYRWAVMGLLVCFGGLVLFCQRAGMAAWVAVFFFGLLFAFALTYGRIRAETGTPSIWALPHSQLMSFPFYTFGSDFFKVGGSFRTLSVWTHFMFLCHGGFYNQTTVYQLESFKLSDELRMRRRTMVWVGLLAVIVGLVLADWMFLTTYYEYGANVLAGGAEQGVGGVRIDYCWGAYQLTEGYLQSPRAADVPRNVAAGVGALIVGGLMAARMIFLRVPLHPLGYIMACIIGSQLWWAFFLAWLLKSVILRLGSVRLYRRLIPAFLGLALGQFFTAGILWGSIANLWPHVRHIVWFT